MTDFFGNPDKYAEGFDEWLKKILAPGYSDDMTNEVREEYAEIEDEFHQRAFRNCLEVIYRHIKIQQEWRGLMAKYDSKLFPGGEFFSLLEDATNLDSLAKSLFLEIENYLREPAIHLPFLTKGLLRSVLNMYLRNIDAAKRSNTPGWDTALVIPYVHYPWKGFKYLLSLSVAGVLLYFHYEILAAAWLLGMFARSWILRSMNAYTAMDHMRQQRVLNLIKAELDEDWLDTDMAIRHLESLLPKFLPHGSFYRLLRLVGEENRNSDAKA